MFASGIWLPGLWSHYSSSNPEFSTWNPESKTVLDSRALTSSEGSYLLLICEYGIIALLEPQCVHNSGVDQDQQDHDKTID